MCRAQGQVLLYLWKVRNSDLTFGILRFLVRSAEVTSFSPLFSPRQLLLCRVALGKPFYQFSAIKMAHSPPGHNSVIGRPSTGGLSFAEYVVYRGEQVSNKCDFFSLKAVPKVQIKLIIAFLTVAEGILFRPWKVSCIRQSRRMK